MIGKLLGAGALMLLLGGLWLIGPELVSPKIDATPLPTDVASIERGRYLARAGNCIACHTPAGGAEYAGGRRIQTPFGDIYSSNLTPDAKTGLGGWTTGDFWRALHYGRSKDGRRLYPAFPYTSYKQMPREDADALFAYLQSLEPVTRPRVANNLRFPYNTQLALMAWRSLFFEPQKFTPDPDRSAEWNRGAYLVEGPGHCKACHTTRNALGGLEMTASYAGGPIPMQGWDALPLTHSKPLNDAEAAALAELLKTGTSSKAVTTGPMAEVVFHSLQYLRDEDISAMVTYIRDLPYTEPPTPPAQIRVTAARKKQLMKTGAILYSEHCADCHGDQGSGQPYQYPALAGNNLVTAASTTNVIRSVKFGGFAPSTMGNPRPYGMPPYAQQFTDAEIAAVLTFIRSSWGNQAGAVSSAQVSRH